MQITYDIMCDSVAQQPFGRFEPFITGTDRDAWEFYSKVLSAMEKVRGISVIRELDHQGSGYASYVSAFLYPSDGRTRDDHPTYIETTGILLYMSRLAPIAVYGASSCTHSKDGKSSSSGFIESKNVGTVPEGDWTEFLADVARCLARFGIEILPREPLLQPAPQDIKIPTIFPEPHYVLDTLFYWSD